MRVSIAFMFALLAVVQGSWSASAASMDFLEFAIYGVESVDMAGRELTGGHVGADADVTVQGSEVASIFSTGNVAVTNGASGNRLVDGDITANGTVVVEDIEDINGSIYSSAAAGTLSGPEVLISDHVDITGGVLALGDVTLIDRSEIEGSLETMGAATLLDHVDVGGNVHTNGAANFHDRVDVTGNLVFGSTYTEGSNVDIDGTVSQGVTNVSPPTFDGASLPSPQSFSSGSGTLLDGSAGTGIGDSLAPGTYGRLESDVISLSGGTYVFSEIEVGQQAALFLDLSQGAITILVEGDVSFLDSVQSLEVFLSEDGLTLSTPWDNPNTHSLASLVWLETHGTFRTAGETSDWFGAVYAPFEGIEANGLSVVGSLYAGGHIDGDTNLAGISLPDFEEEEPFHVFVAPNPPAAVPEPGTGALLGFGLAGLGLRRRRQRAWVRIRFGKADCRDG